MKIIRIRSELHQALGTNVKLHFVTFATAPYANTVNTQREFSSIDQQRWVYNLLTQNLIFFVLGLFVQYFIERCHSIAMRTVTCAILEDPWTLAIQLFHLFHQLIFFIGQNKPKWPKLASAPA